MNTRHVSLTIVALTCFSIACVGCRSSTEGPSQLAANAPAPSLDIEHWLTDAEGRFKPVTKFESGKVYVVEFWATWCGPCRAMMPHIAQLQDRYESEVQFISVSDEDLNTVERFLKSPADGSGTTFGDIAKHYCITTDPDGSTNRDYLEAAGVNSIPHAFIVDHHSRIVWNGHPGEMEPVLEQVVQQSLKK